VHDLHDSPIKVVFKHVDRDEDKTIFEIKSMKRAYLAQIQKLMERFDLARAKPSLFELCRVEETTNEVKNFHTSSTI
jgi:hypothetical protein